EDEIAELQQRARELGRGGVIAPNFALGAVLLMKFAAEAVRYFPDVEVIELHHENKVDAPSGTATKTIELLREALESEGAAKPTVDRSREEETVPSARGGTYHNIPVHSVRLPGFVAHQEVIFGGPGQILTLRHDAPLRTSFMPGVVLACHKVPTLNELYYGLDQILEL
ncbi:MAG: 4-hydroxy-tetrahydrodipicolinate reductase, partial [Planctomycetota bacterium]